MTENNLFSRSRRKGRMGGLANLQHSKPLLPPRLTQQQGISAGPSLALMPFCLYLEPHTFPVELPRFSRQLPSFLGN